MDDFDDFCLGGGAVASSDSGNSESDNDDQDIRFHRAYGRVDERHHAADMIANARKNCWMTRTAVRNVLTDCEIMLEARSQNLKSDVEDYLTRNGLINQPQSVLLLDKFNCDSPFKFWKSDPGQIKAISSYYHYIDSETGFLGRRIEPVNVGNNIFRQLPVSKTCQNVSIIDILKLVSRNATVRDYVSNLRPRNDGILSNYTDGDSYANHPFFNGILMLISLLCTMMTLK